MSADAVYSWGCEQPPQQKSASSNLRLWVEPPSLGLEELLMTLDAATSALSVDRIETLLSQLRIDWEALQPWLRFDERSYQRNLIRGGAVYHALLLCWRPGQRSVIHDHRQSRCGFRVLAGQATESTFDRTGGGQIYPVQTRTLPEGTICCSEDIEIHQISNLEEQSDLVTLHLYSPPLQVMGEYSLTADGVAEFHAPIFEFSAGGGI